MVVAGRMNDNVTFIFYPLVEFVSSTASSHTVAPVVLDVDTLSQIFCEYIVRFVNENSSNVHATPSGAELLASVRGWSDRESQVASASGSPGIVHGGE